MSSRSLTLIAAIVLATRLVHFAYSAPAPATPAAEYATHFGALTKLSIAVAEAMPVVAEAMPVATPAPPPAVAAPMPMPVPARTSTG